MGELILTTFFELFEFREHPPEGSAFANVLDYVQVKAKYESTIQLVKTTVLDFIGKGKNDIIFDYLLEQEFTLKFRLASSEEEIRELVLAKKLLILFKAGDKSYFQELTFEVAGYELYAKFL